MTIDDSQKDNEMMTTHQSNNLRDGDESSTRTNNDDGGINHNTEADIDDERAEGTNGEEEGDKLTCAQLDDDDDKRHDNETSVGERRTDGNKDEDKDKDEDDGCCYRLLARQRFCLCCMNTFPRCSALFLGVLIPLFFLILLSVLFGLILAQSEAPKELADNNFALRDRAAQREVLAIVRRVTALVPEVCYGCYLTNCSWEDVDDILTTIIVEMNGTRTENPFLNFTDEIMEVNTTELNVWMRECGDEAEPIIDRLYQGIARTLSGGTDDVLTFNWIRCFPGARGRDYAFGVATLDVSVEDLRPEAQEEYFTAVWREDAQALYDYYLDGLLAANNTSSVEAKIEAYVKSIDNASGESACELNGAGSGWFWFTILTTVGYGNQAPITMRGQVMVFTLGFLSIVAFAGILATAGYTLSAIVDDALARWNLRALTRPWAMCTLWGAAYYGWMAVIAAVTMSWKRDRLGEESFDMRSGYWFSYISSTTVGLGDIFLEPEVFLGADLVVFPLLFLWGFVLMSAFFTTFAGVFSNYLGKKSLANTLVDKARKSKDSPIDQGVGEAVEAVQEGVTGATAAVEAVEKEALADLRRPIFENHQASEAKDDR